MSLHGWFHQMILVYFEPSSSWMAIVNSVEANFVYILIIITCMQCGTSVQYLSTILVCRKANLMTNVSSLQACFVNCAIHSSGDTVYIWKISIFFLESQRTEDHKNREEILLSQLMTLVKQRDQLVQIEDTQVQQRYIYTYTM